MVMIAAIVIGRNEGDRLSLALESARHAGGPVVYVDSASSDASLSVARDAQVAAISLATPPMLSAARGRNAGLAWVQANFPDAAFVLFLDGDCVLQPGFADAAIRAMDDPGIAVVTGHLREHEPGSSIYARLSMHEWSSDVGDIRDFGNLGGIMCARVAALTEVGGFNPRMIAGEDSELGVRLALAGYRIVKIDAEMALHDNGISSFRAWWQRSVRAGHALAQRYALHGRTAVRDCRREFLSTLFWGIAWPLVTLLLVWPTKGASLILLGGYLVLGLRIRRRLIRAGRARGEANAGMMFGLLGKFANAVGLCRYLLNASTGQFRIIEYKGRAAGTAN
jgi:GT2 family glycosyltransferase